MQQQLQQRHHMLGGGGCCGWRWWHDALAQAATLSTDVLCAGASTELRCCYFCGVTAVLCCAVLCCQVTHLKADFARQLSAAESRVADIESARAAAEAKAAALAEQLDSSKQTAEQVSRQAGGLRGSSQDCHSYNAGNRPWSAVGCCAALCWLKRAWTPQLSCCQTTPKARNTVHPCPVNLQP